MTFSTYMTYTTNIPLAKQTRVLKVTPSILDLSNKKYVFASMVHVCLPDGKDDVKCDMWRYPSNFKPFRRRCSLLGLSLGRCNSHGFPMLGSSWPWVFWGKTTCMNLILNTILTIWKLEIMLLSQDVHQLSFLHHKFYICFLYKQKGIVFQVGNQHLF